MVNELHFEIISHVSVCLIELWLIDKLTETFKKIIQKFIACEIA